jgi:hypothetical protein
VGEHAKLGAGYNVTNFSDDLTGLSTAAAASSSTRSRRSGPTVAPVL